MEHDVESLDILELAASIAANADIAAIEGSESPEDANIPDEMPVLAVRDIVVFNYMILPLFIGREKSIQAIEAALAENQHILLLTQKDEETNDPTPKDLYKMGTVASIMRMLKMPDGRIKVLVQGLKRAKVSKFTKKKPFLRAQVELINEVELAENAEPSVRQEAMLRAAREQSEEILRLRNVPGTDIMSVLNGVDDPGRLADLIAANMRMKVAEAQKVLECVDPDERLLLVNRHLTKEAEVAGVQAEIQHKARESMDKSQKEYLLREQMRSIRKELGENADADDEENADLIAALKKAGMPKEVKAEADKQLRRLVNMHPDSSEYSVIRSYLEVLSEMPWQTMTADRLDIKKAQTILDDDHYGLEKVKDRILEYLSVRKLNPNSKGPILCFVGPPGVGKTSLGRSIAHALGRKFQRFSLGGMRDEAEIRGHRRTYVGAMPGRIMQTLKQLGTRNPVIMLDEVDKIGSDFRGDPSSALLEVLDPEQNNSFSDHYLNVPFDLSKVMFICTANQLETIPSALLDRMEIIRLPGYTMQEKLKIARRYLLPRQIEENGLKKDSVSIDDDVLEKVIDQYTREAGLRNLEREIGTVCRKWARKKAEGAEEPFTVTPEIVEEFLGVPRYIEEEKDKVLLPGVALGLAWTPCGGEVLTIEVCTMAGTGKLQLTGKLGDVMKESAQTAISYIRSHSEALHVDADFSTKRDMHVHVPEGATPKDGPSAGVTLLTASISALSGRPVRSDLCMTGEITLRGRVLPVGGIKEKILGAVSLGLKHVFIPQQNVKDLEDIPADLLKKITVHPAKHIDDILPFALGEASEQDEMAADANKKSEKTTAE